MSALDQDLALAFKLTEEERQSPVFRSLCIRLDAKLDVLRKRNDDATLSDLQTATLRGHIACLKSVLSLAKAPRVEPPMTAERPMLG